MWLGTVYTASTKVTLDYNRTLNAKDGVAGVLCSKKIPVNSFCESTGQLPRSLRLKAMFRRTRDASDMEMQVIMGLYEINGLAPVIEKNFTAKIGERDFTGADIVGALARKATEIFLENKDVALALNQADYFPVSESTSAVSSQEKSTADLSGDSKIFRSLLANLPVAAEKKRYAVAVIIGNKKYAKSGGDSIPDVKFAQNDSRLIREMVIKTLGYHEANIIYVEDATKGNLVGIFGDETGEEGKLSNWVKPNQSDVFVFYSGHGAPSQITGKAFLIPVDGSIDYLDKTGYALDTLYTNLKKIKARTLFVAIDSCFSGNSSEGFLIKNASPALLKTIETPTISDALVITATSKNQIASWDKEAKLGLFTRFLVEGISGGADVSEISGNNDGVVTVKELKTYLSEEVSYASKRAFGRQQNPVVNAKSLGDSIVRYH
jgi:hypothetical protein